MDTRDKRYEHIVKDGDIYYQNGSMDFIYIRMVDQVEEIEIIEKNSRGERESRCDINNVDLLQ